MDATEVLFALTTEQIVDLARATSSERRQIEIKRGEKKAPAAVVETISAFANDQGGVLILGLDDPSIGAKPIQEFRAENMRDSMESRLEMVEPIPQTRIEIEPFEGNRVLRVEVEELPPELKPCFITERGMYKGSYTRDGEGERKLKHYEIDRLLENRKQPTHDRDLVDEASRKDLDADALEALVRYQRETKEKAYRDSTEDEVLSSLGVLAKASDGSYRPTLAGLLAAGKDPQRYFERLRLTMVEYPTIEGAETNPDGTRFLDNKSFEGPIPEIVSRVLSSLKRQMKRMILVSDGKQTERYEYPINVMRELVVNALMHRDYSPSGKQQQVQVEIYPDRITITNPGGFLSNIDENELGVGYISSARNAQLARLLELIELPNYPGKVAENRGSGIRTVYRELRDAGMTPPQFDSNLMRTKVTIYPDALVSEETVKWIEGLGIENLSNQQVQALAAAKRGVEVRNAHLQTWGLHQSDATKELGKLVDLGILRRIGERKGARYVLNPGFESDHVAQESRAGSNSERQSIIELLRVRGQLSRRTISESLGLGDRLARTLLSELTEEGLVTGVGKLNSPKRMYKLK